MSKKSSKKTPNPQELSEKLSKKLSAALPEGLPPLNVADEIEHKAITPEKALGTLEDLRAVFSKKATDLKKAAEEQLEVAKAARLAAEEMARRRDEIQTSIELLRRATAPGPEEKFAALIKEKTIFLVDGSGSMQSGPDGTAVMRPILETIEKTGAKYFAFFAERGPFVFPVADRKNLERGLAYGSELIPSLVKLAPSLRGIGEKKLVIITDGDLHFRSELQTVLGQMLNANPKLTIGVVVTPINSNLALADKFIKELQKAGGGRFHERLFVSTAVNSEQIGQTIRAFASINPDSSKPTVKGPKQG